ncbi:MAG: Swt1 family HEPN domain-containing protein [Caldilineaceae bacterium]
MWRRWNEVFNQKLGYAERNYVSELMTAQRFGRTSSLHQRRRYRVADTATRLLKAINASKQAARSLSRLAASCCVCVTKPNRNASEKNPKPPTASPLSPCRASNRGGTWSSPTPDVANGRYIQAEFAADLAQVHNGEADPNTAIPTNSSAAPTSPTA